MAERSSIEWTDASWNPLPAWGTGLKYTVPNRDKVEIYLDEQELIKPLHWRKPRKIFPCSMTDLFGEWVPDKMIDRMFAVMALCPQHTFLCLTKRSKRMLEYFGDGEAYVLTKYDAIWDRMEGDGISIGTLTAPSDWPLPNVRLGVSVEDQQRTDERIPDLLATPAACRWISAEPLLAGLDLRRWLKPNPYQRVSGGYRGSFPHMMTKIDWVVVGGESGPGARPCHLDWIRAIIAQCKAAGTKVFVKQLGRNVSGDWQIRDRKGGDPSEWPADLRVREQV